MTIVFPHKTIGETCCRVGEWILLGEDGKALPIRGALSGWDYDTKLVLQRHIELEPLRALEETGFEGKEVDLRLNVISLTGPNCYRSLVSTHEVPLIDDWRHDIEISMNSGDLAETLTLKTEITLRSTIEHKMPFVASTVGSRLYLDTEKIQLEGNLGRFPMEHVDFKKSMPGLRANEAMWYLDWDPSRPDSRFLGAVLLYINASQQEVSERIRTMDPVLMAVLRCDVIRTMCEGMLQNEEFVSGFDHFDSDTLGGQVRDWLVAAFDDTIPDVLKNMMQNSPGRFEARIQKAFS